MKKSFCSYWNRRWTGLDVGHRGSGTSFKPTSGDDVIRENTIASLRRAIDAGADMVRQAYSEQTPRLALNHTIFCIFS